MGVGLAYTVSGHRFEGYLADGSKGQPAPGILVIPEASGLGDLARKKADQLADMGYVAYAIDIFGEPVTSMEQAFGFVAQLTEDWQTLRARCNGALQHLAAQPHVEADKLAAIGFCFGGQAAVELARSGAPLKAAVGFHSGLKTKRPEDARNIQGKVLVMLGDQDPIVPVDDRLSFMAAMSEAGVDAQLLLMSGVVHSFTNPEATAFGVPGVAYDARADRRSWAALSSLLTEAFEDSNRA